MSRYLVTWYGHLAPTPNGRFRVEMFANVHRKPFDAEQDARRFARVVSKHSLRAPTIERQECHQVLG